MGLSIRTSLSLQPTSQAIADQPWGDYYGAFKDKFGVQWMVIYSPPQQQ